LGQNLGRYFFQNEEMQIKRPPGAKRTIQRMKEIRKTIPFTKVSKNLNS
jgi:hypothetical protein